MPTNYSLSRLERIYLAVQSSLRAAASITGGDCCRHIKVSLNNEVSTLTRRDKTGSRTATSGVVGRKSGKWSLEMSLSPNGTPGTAPDADPVLQALCGQAPTTTSGSFSITSSTNASPTVLTGTHGLGAAGTVAAGTISGHTGNDINGVGIVQVIDASTVTLLGSTGTGAGTGGTFNKAAVKYSFSDSIPFFSLYAYRTPDTLNQRVGIGCVASGATFNLGSDVAEWSAEGECVWVLESDDFATADSVQKGGLSSFPAEPGTPTTSGGIIAGFTGHCSVDGKTMATIRTGQIRVQTGNAIVKDTFGSYYGDSVEGDERQVHVQFSLYDDDSVAAQNIRKLGNSKTPVDIMMQLGVVAGSTMIAFARGVQLATSQLDDGQRRFTMNVGESRAFGTSLTALDELTIWFV